MTGACATRWLTRNVIGRCRGQRQEPRTGDNNLSSDGPDGRWEEVRRGYACDTRNVAC